MKHLSISYKVFFYRINNEMDKRATKENHKIMEDFKMKKVVEFLNENPVQYLATVGRDGKAKCRPFMFAGELDGKLWFCTNNQKDVYKDM